jgi:hypothetical protein
MINAYFYHEESDSFFIAELSYAKEDHNIQTIYKIGLCVRFTTAEFHHRVIKRTRNLAIRYQHQSLINISKEWVVIDKEMQPLNLPF